MLQKGMLREVTDAEIDTYEREGRSATCCRSDIG